MSNGRVRRCFNPRPPAEGDELEPCASSAYPMFQSTPSCGGRRRKSDKDRLRITVSIHALLRRATIVLTALRTCMAFQSTPSCGGRLRASKVTAVSLRVSIHALLRRATRAASSASLILKFQSTPSCGGRLPAFSSINTASSVVSIHALLRRATPIHRCASVSWYSFNPRPPAEGDYVPVGRWA